MSDFSQQIIQVEEEIRKTPYHKGTEHYIGKLRAKLARLKDKEIEAQLKKARGGGEGYALKKYGDATVVLIGPPSVGKSTLINRLTNAKSKVAEYDFTTLNVIPGMLFYHDAYIQIFDVPGIIEGAKEGKGKGKEVLSVARAADLLLIMCDIGTFSQFPQIENELYQAGIRINQSRPELILEKKTAGGINIRSNIKQNLMPETLVEIAKEMGIKNADITLKEKFTVEKLIDAFSPNRVYIPAIYVINKIDTDKESGKFGDLYQAISALKGIGIEELKHKIWEKLGLVRIYLKNNPFIAKKGQTLKEVTFKIGTEFAEDKKSAKIWGPTARFPGQEVSLSTLVAEGMQIRFV